MEKQADQNKTSDSDSLERGVMGRDGKKEKSKMERCEVVIKFKVSSKEQLDHLFKAQAELRKAGISFDTGSEGGTRDWEFDWSLKGAEVFFKRKAP